MSPAPWNSPWTPNHVPSNTPQQTRTPLTPRVINEAPKTPQVLSSFSEEELGLKGDNYLSALCRGSET